MAVMLPRNQCLIFFRDPESKFDSIRLKEALVAVGLTVMGDSEPFTVQSGDGPSMRVSITRSKTIEGFVRGLVGRKRQFLTLANGCDAQMKIEVKDLDEALDEINTLIDVQSSLQAATGGLMYNSWNQQFSAPTNA